MLFATWFTCVYHSFVCACVLTGFNCVQPFMTLWTRACQAPLSMGILQERILEWVAIPSCRGSSWTRDKTCISQVSCTGRGVPYYLAPPGKPCHPSLIYSFLKQLISTTLCYILRTSRWIRYSYSLALWSRNYSIMLFSHPPKSISP